MDIEDYVLDQAQVTDRKMSVFTGPIFRDQDPEYGRNRDGGPWDIPMAYWKVVVVRKSDETIAATAFMTGQVKFLEKLFESKVFSKLRQNRLPKLQSNNIQVPITVIEDETGLNFGTLRRHDIASALESTRQSRFLQSIFDINF